MGQWILGALLGPIIIVVVILGVHVGVHTFTHAVATITPGITSTLLHYGVPLHRTSEVARDLSPIVTIGLVSFMVLAQPRYRLYFAGTLGSVWCLLLVAIALTP